MALKKHKRRESMPSVGIEPTTTGIERFYADAVDYTASGISPHSHKRIRLHSCKTVLVRCMKMYGGNGGLVQVVFSFEIRCTFLQPTLFAQEI
jgi:hypothetical protein